MVKVDFNNNIYNLLFNGQTKSCAVSLIRTKNFLWNSGPLGSSLIPAGLRLQAFQYFDIFHEKPIFSFSTFRFLVFHDFLSNNYDSLKNWIKTFYTQNKIWNLRTPLAKNHPKSFPTWVFNPCASIRWSLPDPFQNPFFNARNLFKLHKNSIKM